MLVLTRRANEEIVIGERIVLTVVEIRGDRVRLGLTAPKDVAIYRREVHESIAGNWLVSDARRELNRLRDELSELEQQEARLAREIRQRDTARTDPAVFQASLLQIEPDEMTPAEASDLAEGALRLMRNRK